MPLAAEETRATCGFQLAPEVAHGVPQPALLNPVLADIDRAIDELAQSPAAPLAAPRLPGGR